MVLLHSAVLGVIQNSYCLGILYILHWCRKCWFRAEGRLELNSKGYLMYRKQTFTAHLICEQCQLSCLKPFSSLSLPSGECPKSVMLKSFLVLPPASSTPSTEFLLSWALLLFFSFGDFCLSGPLHRLSFVWKTVSIPSWLANFSSSSSPPLSCHFP